jgi:hypothetical protein
MEPLSTSACAFCGSGAAFATDLVWPAWILRRFPDHGADQQMTDVCESCTGGWMSRLDQSVAPLLDEPMLKRVSTNWTPAEQRTLALWAMKTAMVLELSEPSDSGHFFTDTERWLFMDLLDPPFNDIRVWAAAREDERPVDYRGARIKLLRPDSGRQVGDVFVATMSLGHVVFQMTARRLFEPRLSIVDVPFPPESSDWQDVTVALWPPSESPREWPPRLTLDANALEAFGNRWNERIKASVSG